ncbi:ParB/RepB/Spo0J family partition protein [bacterium]|nr:ParB/RepB/Spo0J family partition protein [bacterium]
MDATATRPRLGRGLTALLGDAPAAETPANRLPVEAVAQNPYQPRKRFDDDELDSLTASVKEHGVLQPLVVRQTGDGFQLIAGERRLRAAQAAGLTEVPVHVVAFDDQQVFEAALVENIQRSDLNPIEKAQGFRDYLNKFGVSQEVLGAKLGLDRTTVSNLLGLLNLPTEVQDAVRLGQISLGHAKVLKGVPEAERQLVLCRETILKNYSVHALELLVKQQRLEAAAAATAAANEEPEERRPAEKTAHVKGIEDDLRQRLAVKIEIKVKAKDRGQIVIAFDSNDDFERIVGALTK